MRNALHVRSTIQCPFSARIYLQTKRGWNRVVVEKPFGTDLASSSKLAADLSKFFTEDQVGKFAALTPMLCCHHQP